MSIVGSTAFTYIIDPAAIILEILVPTYTVTDGSGCPSTAPTKELWNDGSVFSSSFIVTDWAQNKLKVSTTDISFARSYNFSVKVLAGISVNQDFTFTLTLIFNCQ